MLPCSADVYNKLSAISHSAKRVGKAGFVQELMLQMKPEQEPTESRDHTKEVILCLIRWLLNHCMDQRRQKCNRSSEGNNAQGVWGCVLV